MSAPGPNEKPWSCCHSSTSWAWNMNTTPTSGMRKPLALRPEVTRKLGLSTRALSSARSMFPIWRSSSLRIGRAGCERESRPQGRHEARGADPPGDGVVGGEPVRCLVHIPISFLGRPEGVRSVCCIAARGPFPSLTVTRGRRFLDGPKAPAFPAVPDRSGRAVHQGCRMVRRGRGAFRSGYSGPKGTGRRGGTGG